MMVTYCALFLCFLAQTVFNVIASHEIGRLKVRVQQLEKGR